MEAFFSPEQTAFLKSKGTRAVMSLNWKETMGLPEAKMWSTWMSVHPVARTQQLTRIIVSCECVCVLQTKYLVLPQIFFINMWNMCFFFVFKGKLLELAKFKKSITNDGIYVISILFHFYDSCVHIRHPWVLAECDVSHCTSRPLYLRKTCRNFEKLQAPRNIVELTFLYESVKEN